MHSPVPPPGSLHDARDAYTSGAHAGALTRETKSIKFEWIRSVLTAVSYDHLSRDDKGVVREYIRSVTGYSRAHVERSIAAYRLSGIRELRPVQALRLPQIAEKAVALVRRTELQWTMGVAVLTLFVLILGRSAVGPSASLLSLPVPARGPQAALTRVAGFTAEHIVTPSITIPAFTAEPTIIAIGELSFSRITSTSQVRRDERRLARQGITGAVVAFDPLPAEQSTAQLALVSQVQSADTQRSLQDRIRERALQRGGVRSSAVTDAPSQYSTSASPSRTYGPLVEEQGALEFALMTQLQSIEAQRALQERVRDRAAQRQLTRVNPAAPAAPVGSVTGVPTQSSAGTGRPTEGGVQRGELTASQLIRVMGPAEEGQVIMIVNGKAVWRDLPSLIERVIQGTEGRETGVGRAPRGGGGHASGDDGGRSGRGGGSTITDANDGKIESHDHQNDAGGGVLDINGATNGILRVEQGGTGFGNFATGDLLVGTAGGGLDKLAKGTNGQTLTVSNGTLSWGSAGAGDLTQANADLRYVSVAGDTMTGALAIFSTLAASGAVRFDSDLTLNDDQTASDTILTFGSDSTNETLKFLNNEDRFEFSDDIRATGSIQGSGTLIIDGATVFKSTIRLNGVTYTFPTSDGTSSGKVLKTNGAGQLVWTSDADTGASGITQTSGDARYVNVSGDTMTGALSVKRTAGTSTGNTLVIDTKGLIYDASNKRVGIGTATPRTALEVLGTISGSMLNIRDNITASGTLVIQGATTLKSTLGVTGNISGNADLSLNADQTAADTILTFGSDTTNETLKFLNNEDRFEFSDDLNVTGGLYASGAAIIGGSQLVKGDLTINSDAGAADTVLTFGSDSTNETLKFLNNEDRFEASDDFRATGSLQASGALIIDGAATFKSTIRLNGVTYTFPTSDGTASGKVLKTNSAGVLSWSADIDTDTNTTYGAGQGLTLNGTTFSLTNTFSGTSLEIMGTASGRILHAQDELRSSGSLVVEGAFSLNSYQDFFEIAAPASPSASTLRLWAESQNGFGQLHFKNSSGLDYQLGRDNIMTVRNTTGVAITKGQWVYISGSTGVVPNVALAKADSASTMPAMGVAVADISNNSFGQIMTMGDVQGLDTSAFNDGDVLYISASTAGAVTTTRATGTSMDQRVGVVVKDSVGAGIIAVMIGGEFDPSTTQTFSNKTFSGNTEFIGTASGRILHAQDELHSSGSLVVEGATVLNSTIRLNGVTYTFPTSDGSATGKVLKTNSAGVLSWSSDIGSFATIQTEADTRYVNVSGDTMTGALTILKAAGTSTGNTLVIDTKGLIYDASNKRVGIGTATPRTALEVLGTISGSTLNIRDNITASGTLAIQGASTLKSTLAVTGNITANADLSLNADQTAADTVATFGSDGTNETLKFLNLEDRFEFSDDLNATGGLYASGALIIGGAGSIKGDLTINADVGAADTVLTFGSDGTSETVKFLNNEDRFEFSDDLRATGSIQGSGTLIVDGAATFKSTIRLNGVTYTFPTSDGSATGKVLKTDSAGVLSWSSDIGSFATIQTEADTRYVNVSGDTMTGALTILKAAGTSTGNTLVIDTKGLIYDATNKRVGIGTATPRTALEVLGTISGSTLNIRDNITASGTLVIQGASTLKSTLAVTGNITANADLSLNADQTAADTVATFGSDGTNETLKFLNLEDRFEFSDDLNATGGLYASGALIIGGAGLIKGDFTINSDQTAANTVLTFGSDTTNETVTFLNAADRFEFSDDLAVTGGLFASGAFVTDGAAVFKSTIRLNGVTYTFPTSDGSATGKVLKTNSAGVLSWSSDIGSFATIQTEADTRYVNVSGDTMTGALTILKAAGTSTGNTLVIDTKGLIYDATNKRVGIGTTTPRTALEVLGVISGSTLNIRDNITASGTLAIQGASTLKSTLAVTGNITANADLSLNADQTAADTVVTFGSDDTNETLKFLNLEDRFEFSDDLNATGGLYASGALIIGGAGSIKGDLTINSDVGAADTVLTFGSDGTSETVKFLNNEDRFEFSDDLRATGSIQGSGTLIIDGAATFKSTIRLNGVTYTFPTSDGSATGKVLKTDSAGVLSWSSDIGSFATIQSDADARYVNVAGDTMTGALTIKKTSGTSTGNTLVIDTKGLIYDASNKRVGIGTTTPRTALEVLGTISGSTLNIRDNITASGTLVIQGASTLKSTLAVTGNITANADATLNADQTAADTVLTFGSDSTNETLKFLNLEDRFEFSDDLNATGGLYASGAMIIGGAGLVKGDFTINSDQTAADTVLTFGSDTTNETVKFLNNEDRFEVSDDFRATGSIQGSGTLIVDGAATFKSTIRLNGVTYTFPTSDGSATGKVLKTDSAGNLSWSTDNNSGGMGFAEAASYFVDDTGDTMSGALSILKTAGTSTGNTLIVDTKGLVYDASNKRVGIGTATPRTALEVLGTISGSTLNVRDNITASGTLVIQGATVLKSTVNIPVASTTNTQFGAGATGFRVDTTNGQFILGNGGYIDGYYGELQLTGGTDSVSGTKRIITAAGKNLSLMPGGYVGISTTNPKARLTVVGSGAFTQTVSGSALTFMGGDSYILGNLGIGKSGTPTTKLEVLGTISGSMLNIRDNITASGTLVVDGVLKTKSDLTINADAGAADTVLTFGSDTTNETLKFLNNEDRFEFSDDLNVTGGLYSSGALIVASDSKFKGDLTINSDAGAADTILTFGSDSANETLKFLNNEDRFEFSDDLNVTGGLYASGALIIGSASIFKNTLEVQSTLSGAALTIMAGDSSFLGELGIGTSAVEARLEVAGTMSGRALQLTGTGAKPLIATDISNGRLGFGTTAPTQFITMSGGVFEHLAGATPALLSGADVTSNVTAVVVESKYAYIGHGSISGNDFRVVDIGNPRKPSTVGGVDLGSGTLSIAVAGDYAYVGHGIRTGDDFRVIDISNASNPFTASGIDIGANTNAVEIAGKNAYLGTNAAGAEFQIVDVSNPYHPLQKKLIDIPGKVYSLAIEGHYAYVGYTQPSSNGSGVSVYDVSKIQNPSLVDTITIGDSATVRALQAEGKFLYVGNTTLAGTCSGSTVAGCEFRIYNLTDTTNAVPLGGYDIGAAVNSIDIAGRYAYIGIDTVAGKDFRIIDISNPALPVEIGGVDMTTDVYAVAVAGKYAYLGHGSLAGNDMRIVDLAGIDAPTATIGAIAANSLSIAGDASIGNDLTVGNSITVGVGGIQSMGPVGIFTGTGSFTGAIIHNRSERGPVLALDSMTGSDIGAHILFGYMGNFDTNLYRSSGSTLRSDDKLLLTATNAENRELIRLDTEESTGSQNVFIIVSDVTSGENTVFRINASGATFSDQPYTSGGADYAEWFYSSDTDLERGEVVCIDVTSPNTVERCTQTADGNVMGIISSNPAFIGNSLTGAEGLPVPGYFLVGLIGQVPARVTTENGPIRPGDSLTSASIPGFARRADSGESTVGVALEGLETGDGIVNVLISRRNQSLTVEAVEQHVLETIAAMEIDDEVQIMVTKALSEEGFNERISEAVRTQVGMLDLASQIEAMIDAKLSGQSGSTIASPIAISAEGVQIATDLTALSDVEFQSALRVVGPMTLSGSLSALGGISTTSLQVAKTIEVMGDGRIGGDLHVDGTLIVDEIIATKPLFVDGDLNFGGSLHGAALFLNSGAYLKGDLEVEGDLKVHGALDIDNLEISGAVDVGTLLVRDAVHVLGPITIDGLATFFGDVDVRGDLIVSNRQAGYASIPKTGTAVTVLFGTGGFRTLPIVSASPDVPVLFAVSRATMTGFTIRLGLPAPEAVTFSWIALATSEPLTAEGMSTGNTALIPFPVDSHGVPLSSNAIWNACIRNLTILDEQGQPLSCGRYHQDSTWTHPDLGISFVWNTDSEPPILTLPDGYEVVVTETDDEGADEEEIQTGTGALLEEPAVGSGTDAIEEEPLSGTGSDIVTSSGSDALSPEPEAGSGSAEGGNSVDSGSGTQTPLNPIPETASGAVEQGSGGTVE